MVILKKGIAKIRNTASNKHWVEQIIDDFLDTRIEEDRSGREFHPSASGKCPRMIQFSMIGMVKEKFEPRIKRIFDNGHDMHNRYKRYFERAGKLIAEEAPVRATIEGIKIRGRADLIVKNFMDEDRLLELKTTNSRKFEEILKKGQCLEDHYIQWNIYAGILGIHMGEILYENKDDQRMKIFTVSFSKERFDKTIDMFKIIDYHIINGTIVPKPDICNSRYCAAKDLCRKIDNKAEKNQNIVQLGKEENV